MSDLHALQIALVQIKGGDYGGEGDSGNHDLPSRFIMSGRAASIGDPTEGVLNSSDDEPAPKVLADILESIIGATYLDSGGDLEITAKVLMIWFLCLHHNR